MLGGTIEMAAAEMRLRKIALVTGAWLVLALLLGASERLSTAPVPVIPAIVLTLVAIVLIALWRSASFRVRAAAIDMRWLVAVHLTRFVGFYFLFLHDRGRFPWAFAVPGGWGDIAVAVVAFLVFALVPPRGRAAWQVYVLWNVLGLADILMVVATAARLALADRASMIEVTRLPLSLLPTFLVPIIISTHVIMLARLVAARRRGSDTF